MILLKLIIGLGIGAGFGVLLGLSRSCETGACPLTANPWRGAFFGGVLGLMFALTLTTPDAASRQNNAEGAPKITNASSGSSEEGEDIDIQELDEDNFSEAIGEGVVLVDFWAPWCGPCRQQLPILESLAKNVDEDAVIAKVNVDNNREISSEYGVRSIPTLILFADGEPVERFVGVQSERVLKAAIAEASEELESE